MINTNVKFKVKPNTLLDKILSFIGFVKYDKGYFHQLGYSGNQTDNKHDIAIIEKVDGRVVTVPITDYKIIK